MRNETYNCVYNYINLFIINSVASYVFRLTDVSIVREVSSEGYITQNVEKFTNIKSQF